jgi:hypothetical protein
MGQAAQVWQAWSGMAASAGMPSFMCQSTRTAQAGRFGMQAVVHPDAFAPGQHQTGFAQHAKMAGNFGLRRIERGVQVTDTTLIMDQQQAQDAPADRVAECFKKGFEKSC